MFAAHNTIRIIMLAFDAMMVLMGWQQLPDTQWGMNCECIDIERFKSIEIKLRGDGRTYVFNLSCDSECKYYHFIFTPVNLHMNVNVSFQVYNRRTCISHSYTLLEGQNGRC